MLAAQFFVAVERYQISFRRYFLCRNSYRIDN